MHLTLKKEATKPASFNFLQQQERFDRFIEVYNHERPHQALNGRLSRRSVYTVAPHLPAADRARVPLSRPVRPVTRCGRICIGRRKINLSKVFAGQIVGIREVDDQIWLVSFLDYDLGFFDQDEGRVEPAPNPFAPEQV